MAKKTKNAKSKNTPKATQSSANTDRPNILVIFGDDIGYWNVGAYTHGMMGRTPNIDSIARDGMLFTDHYGQPSCTPGRAAAMTGRLPIRSGMTTVSFPGQGGGLPAGEWTVASVLKQAGYSTCQIGRASCRERVCNDV